MNHNFDNFKNICDEVKGKLVLEQVIGIADK